jgi:hypothetical protein
MGELALKRIQAGTETTRGTVVAATRRVYGSCTITRARPNRFANEDRGEWTDKFRANPKLIEAGFSITSDAVFEDMPWYASLFYNGNIAQTGSATTGYTWTSLPDQTSDTLKTATLEAGDDAVAWQGAFACVDTADFTLALDDAVTVQLGGFVADWLPQNSGSLTTTFTGFTGAIADHAVESVMGYQAKFYLDNTGGTAGTTQVPGKFISAQWGIHNQMKRKYFGDGTAKFTKLGRGNRQVHCQVVLEASDTAQYAQFYNGQLLVARIALTGVGIAGSTGPVLKAQNYDFYGIWDTFAIGARDTNTTFQFDLQAMKDATALTEHKITVINQNSTI